ncbi:MAG: S1 RNA-binding domain-containing protein, partial [Deltaproteobacteria bacterium]
MSTEPETQESAPAPRVQLKPTVDPEQARPVPSFFTEPSSPAATAETAPQPTPEPPDRGPSATDVAAREKVEIPARGAALDAELEAEINAALEGGASLALEEVPGEGPKTAATEPGADRDLEIAAGTKVKGKVLSVHGDSVIVDIGARSSGVVPARNFEPSKLPAVGAYLEVVVEKYDPAEGLIELAPAKATIARPAGDWNSVAEGQIVDC